MRNRGRTKLIVHTHAYTCTDIMRVGISRNRKRGVGIQSKSKSRTFCVHDRDSGFPLGVVANVVRPRVICSDSTEGAVGKYGTDVSTPILGLPQCIKYKFEV